MALLSPGGREGAYLGGVVGEIGEELGGQITSIFFGVRRTDTN